MNLILTLITGAALCSMFMTLLWYLQKKKSEADIVDFGWTICLGFLGVYYCVYIAANQMSAILTALFSAIWSFRLATHLWERVESAGEDGRYIALRKGWGDNAQRNFFIFFQAQALLAVVLSLSFLVPALQTEEPTDWQILLALFWFVLCICAESLADLQLNKWRADKRNAGLTCRLGLWNYSRHPNYFFEWLYWFSFTFLALQSEYWYLTLVSPALLLYSILKVTGIPPTEARALITRGEDYRQYQKTTSAFIPWFKNKL